MLVDEFRGRPDDETIDDHSGRASAQWRSESNDDDMKAFPLIPALLLALNAVGQDNEAQDLIAKPDPEELKELYDRYVKSDFSKIASELAKAGANSSGLMMGCPTSEQLEKPWEVNRHWTLVSAWDHHTKNLAEHFETLMVVVEDKEVGDSGRRWALRDVGVRLRSAENATARKEKWVPDFPGAVKRLRVIVEDETESDSFRRAVLAQVNRHGDPNQHVDLLVGLSDRVPEWTKRAEEFRRAASVIKPEKLTPKNRARILRYAMNLLEKTDDGAGYGYFLAMTIGYLAGVAPVAVGKSPFQPDQELEKYQDGNGGLKESFFQDTVENARSWWAKNQAEFGG